MSSRLREILDRGDAEDLRTEWEAAQQAEAEGRFCQCVTPDIESRLHGFLCLACGLYQEQWRNERRATMLAPHPFEPLGPESWRVQFCAVCQHNRSDTRHRQ